MWRSQVTRNILENLKPSKITRHLCQKLISNKNSVSNFYSSQTMPNLLVSSTTSNVIFNCKFSVFRYSGKKTPVKNHLICFTSIFFAYTHCWENTLKKNWPFHEYSYKHDLKLRKANKLPLFRLKIIYFATGNVESWVQTIVNFEHSFPIYNIRNVISYCESHATFIILGLQIQGWEKQQDNAKQ